MTIGELMAKARAELPEDWEIHVAFTRGCTTVFLEDPNGDDQDYPGRYGENVQDVEVAMLAALEEAKRAAAPGPDVLDACQS